MSSREFLDIAEEIIAGKSPDIKMLAQLARTPDQRVFEMLAGAYHIRNRHFGNAVHLCNICNGKSGKCSEDCAFCSQSAFSASSDVPVYPLLPGPELRKGAEFTGRTPIHRYSVVTSGRRLPKNEVAKIAEAFSEMDSENTAYCASLGILDTEDLRHLKAAGVTRYHHNLETARSHFNTVCTTHTYQERVETIHAAKAAGLSVCSGGLFGIGETDAQVLELALDLKALDVDAVPLNFLVPMKGTRMEGRRSLSPLRCLKIIALFRYVLPDKDILVCGGRLANLKSLHPLIFYAGASGMMTGNYLTTTGQTLGNDLDLIEQLGLTVSP
ncbi:biotin synthase BioB [Desulfonema ishimotonii]|uniref:Biotin synthase n=1 Tax=Desulfonema ishimotonii TaxID=45657 RepID=A0A401G1S2_9BACT|nr:biotin synthase BioB [Desulfonema ishimotonii]GBC63170.1 biotin synthase BioB [Desulfonema ishimotonii]